MNTSSLLVISIAAILILLYHDSRQGAVPPSYSYSRSGMQLVANSESRSEDLQRAAETLYEALRLDPKDPTALFAMAWALQLKGAEKEAFDYYAKTLVEANELQKFSNYNLSFIYEKQGNLTEALQHAERALMADPNFALGLSRKEQLSRLIQQNISGR